MQISNNMPFIGELGRDIQPDPLKAKAPALGDQTGGGVTSMALGEESGGVTTAALGEESAGPGAKSPAHQSEHRRAPFIGDLGRGYDPVALKAKTPTSGNEIGSATTMAVGEEGGEITTMALGEEGGGVSTMAFGEESRRV